MLQFLYIRDINVNEIGVEIISLLARARRQHYSPAQCSSLLMLELERGKGPFTSLIEFSEVYVRRTLNY